MLDQLVRSAHIQWMQEQWHRIARRYQYGINAAWWLYYLLPALTGLNLIACICLLLLRRFEADWGFASILYGACAIALVIFSGLFSRKHFEQRCDVWVRLEQRYKLKGRLLAALDGHSSWPDIPEERSALIRAEWARLLLPVMISLLLLTGGVIIPVGNRAQGDAPYTVEAPQGWAKSEQWIESLKQTGLFDNGALQEFEQQLAALRQEPPEQWYQDGAREASDSLQKTLQEISEAAALQLASSASQLEQLSREGAAMSQAEREAMEKQFQSTLQNMQSGLMPLQKDIASQMANLDFKQLQNISPEQMQAMCENMQQGAQQCAQIAGISDEMLTAQMQQRRQAGAGEPLRGPGHEDLLFGELSPGQQTQVEGIRNDSMENAAVGDLLNIQETAANQQNDQFMGVSTGGGEPVTAEQAREATWRIQLTPEEKSVVKEYFHLPSQQD